MVASTSVRHFGQSIYRLLDSLADPQNELEIKDDLLKGQEYIQPIHCDQVLHVSLSLQEPIQKICELLEQNESLPQAIRPLCYAPLATFHHIDKRLYNLKNDLISLRSCCLQSHKKTQRHRNEVQKSLSIILLEGDKAKAQLQTMLERALFQERRMQ